MSPDPLVHLHVASGFSLQYGASHPHALVERAVAHEMDTLALTDRDGTYGVVKFVRAARSAGVRPAATAPTRPSGQAPARPSDTRPTERHPLADGGVWARAAAQSRAARPATATDSVQLTLRLGDEPGEPGERPTGLPEMTTLERMRAELETLGLARRRRPRPVPRCARRDLQP